MNGRHNVCVWFELCRNGRMASGKDVATVLADWEPPSVSLIFSVRDRCTYRLAISKIQRQPLSPIPAVSLFSSTLTPTAQAKPTPVETLSYNGTKICAIFRPIANSVRTSSFFFPPSVHFDLYTHKYPLNFGTYLDCSLASSLKTVGTETSFEKVDTVELCSEYDQLELRKHGDTYTVLLPCWRLAFTLRIHRAK